MVLIKDLKSGQGSVEVSGIITEIGGTRVFSKFGKDLKVANAILQDESSSIKLTLWNEDVSRFKEGDRIKIVNGFVNEYEGDKQLTSGKFGHIEKLTSANEITQFKPTEIIENIKPEFIKENEEDTIDYEVDEKSFNKDNLRISININELEDKDIDKLFNEDSEDDLIDENEETDDSEDDDYNRTEDQSDDIDEEDNLDEGY